MDFFNGGELYHYLSMGRFSEVGCCEWVAFCIGIGFEMNFYEFL